MSFDLSCPIPFKSTETIEIGHGGGGLMTRQLVEGLFRPAFGAGPDDLSHDGAVFEYGTVVKLLMRYDELLLYKVFGLLSRSPVALFCSVPLASWCSMRTPASNSQLSIFQESARKNAVFTAFQDSCSAKDEPLANPCGLVNA